MITIGPADKRIRIQPPVRTPPNDERTASCLGFKWKLRCRQEVPSSLAWWCRASPNGIILIGTLFSLAFARCRRQGKGLGCQNRLHHDDRCYTIGALVLHLHQPLDAHGTHFVSTEENTPTVIPIGSVLFTTNATHGIIHDQGYTYWKGG